MGLIADVDKALPGQLFLQFAQDGEPANAGVEDANGLVFAVRHDHNCTCACWFDLFRPVGTVDFQGDDLLQLRRQR